MRKINKIVLSVFFIAIVFFVGGFFIFPLLKEKGNIRLKVAEIREEYRGVIIEKFSVRNTPPTHLRIKVMGGEEIKISPNQEIVNRANKGDSIIKPKNENFVFLITPEGVRDKIFYTKLSYETRNSKYFPTEWKTKWMESSKWDK
ncbi:hypothetical protein [Ascidiimonas aurantiaca]|uniref:hypothetical protein n=1 Tax=Ascidiimonas aurantiaca TaxID=1685432 RepID=UPI0030EF4063